MVDIERGGLRRATDYGRLGRLRSGIPGWGGTKFLHILKLMLNYADTSPTEFSISLFLLVYATFLTWNGPGAWNVQEFAFVSRQGPLYLWVGLLYALGTLGFFSLASCYPATKISRTIRFCSSFFTATVVTFMGVVRYLGDPNDSSFIVWIGMGMGAWWLVYRSERVYHYAPR